MLFDFEFDFEQYLQYLQCPLRGSLRGPRGPKRHVKKSRVIHFKRLTIIIKVDFYV